MAPGCDRRARSGSAVCDRHRRTPLDRQVKRELKELADELRKLAMTWGNDERRRVARRFGQRVERGDFALLFAGRSADVLDMPGDGLGVREEIGALRISILRMLMEVDDPVKMAYGISRNVDAITRAFRTDRVSREGREASLGELLAAILSMDGEKPG